MPQETDTHPTDSSEELREILNRVTSAHKAVFDGRKNAAEDYLMDAIQKLSAALSHARSTAEAGEVSGQTARPQMGDELLPCPFCGSNAIKVARDPTAYIGGVNAIAFCKKCGANGANRKTLEEATAVWNRRVPPPPDRGMAGALAKELKRLIQYGRWQISEESPGWHPTLPSAVGAAAETLARYEASTASQPQPERRAMVGASRLQAIIAELKSFPPSPLIEDAIDSLERIS